MAIVTTYMIMLHNVLGFSVLVSRHVNPTHPPPDQPLSAHQLRYRLQPGDRIKSQSHYTACLYAPDAQRLVRARAKPPQDKASTVQRQEQG